jgi:thioredoxin 1
MKKMIFPLLGVLVIALSGCGGQSASKNSNTDEVVSARDAEMSKDHKGTIHLTKQDFLHKVMNYEENPQEWVYRGSKPCLIDFYADWCAPCRITSPILEELAEEYHGRIHIYKVDTEKERELAAVFGIQSIPSFLFCPMEGNPLMIAGIARTPEETKQMFREQIEKLLLKSQS